MRGFELDDKGDLVIQNGRVSLLSGEALEAQSLRQLIGTNRGEWWLNENQGIRFGLALRKNPNMDLLQNEIQRVLLAVDGSWRLTAFHCETRPDRTASINFRAKKGDGPEVDVSAAL